MQFFYDGANPKELEEVIKKGCISGVTTNVNFVVDYASKNSINNYFDAIKPTYEIAASDNQNLPFSIQAVGNNSEELINSAKKIKDNFSEGVKLFIKIPVNYENLYAIKYLSQEEKINVNATCITSFLQASIACSSGASILSYFWGKMTDEGIDPCEHVISLKKFIRANNLNSQILCGSIRQSRVIHEAFNSGADILTLPYNYFPKIAARKKSDEATEIFNESWNSSKLKLN